MPPYRLVEEIVSRSIANTWQEAKREWELTCIYFADRPGTCLCGHSPILELCVLRNRENGNEAVVGNACVTRFMGLPSDRLFASLKRIATDKTSALNAAMIAYAHDKGWLTEWEKKFCLNTMKWSGRNLSAKQMAIRVKINETILRLALRTEASHA